MLRQPVRGQLPTAAAVLGPVDTEAAVRRDPVPTADLARRAAGGVLGDHERHVRVAVMDRDREAEAARKAVVLESLPVLAAVIGAVDAAVVLLPEALGLRGVYQDLVHALAELWERIVGHEVG